MYYIVKTTHAESPEYQGNSNIYTRVSVHEQINRHRMPVGLVLFSVPGDI